MSDRELDFPNLPNHWPEIEPDAIYRSAEGRLVSFSKTQIQLGSLYDPINKPIIREVKPVTRTLKNHPIWHNLAQTLLQLNSKQIALEHLQACQAQINGYWDEDEFYETITFTQMPDPELMSSSLGLSAIGRENPHWLQLKFALNPNPSHQNLGKGKASSTHDAVPALGELILLLDENLQVVDENWLIDLQSPYVLARS